MALDVEALLAPLAGDTPVGPDLYSSPERAEITQAFDRDASDRASQGAASVDWRKIIRLIETQTAITKDLWLAVYLTRAGAWASDVGVIRTGAEYLAGLCDRYWDKVHPSLDAVGFEGRKMACQSLASMGDFILPLNRMKLLEHSRHGVFLAEDFKRFQAGDENLDGFRPFRAALDATPEATLIDLAKNIEAAETAIRRVDGVLMAKAEAGAAANFQATYDALGSLRASVLAFTSQSPGREAEAPLTDSGPGDRRPPIAEPGLRTADAIESRDDVVRALDAIADYYRRMEPTSPVPLVLERARGWVNLDFLAALEDIAPGSLEEARRVLTVRKP